MKSTYNGFQVTKRKTYYKRDPHYKRVHCKWRETQRLKKNPLKAGTHCDLVHHKGVSLYFCVSSYVYEKAGTIARFFFDARFFSARLFYRAIFFRVIFYRAIFFRAIFFDPQLFYRAIFFRAIFYCASNLTSGSLGLFLQPNLT